MKSKLKYIPKPNKLTCSFIVLLAIATILISCSYSFTGASVPKHLQTIAVPNFIDNSGKGESDLDTRFTYQTIQKFINDNSLKIADKKNADAIIDCTITRFTELPASISGEETIDNMRITITVKVIYRDLVEKKKIFEQTFSNHYDYSNSGGNFQEARTEAIDTVIDMVSEDILLGVVANW